MNFIAPQGQNFQLKNVDRSPSTKKFEGLKALCVLNYNYYGSI